jgi:hypothetical protein
MSEEEVQCALCGKVVKEIESYLLIESVIAGANETIEVGHDEVCEDCNEKVTETIRELLKSLKVR